MTAECIFDGHHGQYIHQMVVDLADSLGWHMSDQDRKKYEAREDNSATDFMMDLADEALLWLNDNAEDGWSYGWCEGEFFFASDEWWEEDDGIDEYPPPRSWHPDTREEARGER